MGIVNILARQKLYGSDSECTRILRPEDTDFPEFINMDKPALIFQGNYGPSAKLYSKFGRSTSFMIKSLDKRSTLVPGQLFDVKKCLITEWKRPDSNEYKYYILVNEDALVTQ